MDCALIFHRLHLLQGNFRAEGFESFICCLAEVAHIDLFVPGLRAITDCITATNLFFLDIPAAGTGHTDNRVCLRYQFADLFDRQHLAEMLLFRLVNQSGFDSFRKVALFSVDGFEPSESLKALTECRGKKGFDILAAVQVRQQVIGIVCCILIPYLPLTVRSAELTHRFSPDSSLLILYDLSRSCRNPSYRTGDDLSLIIHRLWHA